MANVFTKNEIIQSLASQGFFIDGYTLDTFLKKWRVEAIFEDEQGSEFYDKNTLDLIVKNFFNDPSKNASINPPNQNEIPQKQNINPSQGYIPNQNLSPNQGYIPNQNLNPNVNNFNYNYQQTPYPANQQVPLRENETLPPENSQIPPEDYEIVKQDNIISFEGENKKKKLGILEGAMQLIDEGRAPRRPKDVSKEIIATNDDDIDDMSLLSESIEAQEKLKEYVLSEMARKNIKIPDPNGEYKVDIPEQALSTVANTIAKKIADEINSIYSAEAKAIANYDSLEEENKKLSQKIKTLEDQNKKLRLLLAESNKNLNSYKPSIFGLYAKIKTKN